MSYQPDPDDRFVVHDRERARRPLTVICDVWHRLEPTETISGLVDSPAYIELVQRCQEMNAAHNARLREQARQIQEEGTLPLGLALTLDDVGRLGKSEEEKR